MAKKLGFLSGDLNGNGKTGWFERILGLDPGVRAVAGLWRGATGRNQVGGWPSIPKQDFTTQSPWQVNDVINNINPQYGGLPQYNYGKPNYQNPYTRQNFELTQKPQDMVDYNAINNYANMGMQGSQQRITPTQMPVRNGLDFMDTSGTAYQSRYAQPYVNPMSKNNGYFDMNKASTAGGNWVQGAGWRTDANKAAGQTEDDMQFNAQMAQRLGNMSQ